ncbi:hypothetical protein [Alicycliphilus denitrificans]|uniref:hypothetical protein n=1 Tax=Alicycliphilus denitrificans TaxID=179636 RepID=UPI00384DCD9D
MSVVEEKDMTGPDLFVHLVQRMRVYADAAVLWILLKEEADVTETGTTSGSMAETQLCNSIDRKTAQRSLQRLEVLGFITTRVHKNTKTLVTVNREAVLDLLRQRIPERLPAVSKKQFAFLDAWNADRAAIAAAEAIAAASQSDGSAG